MMGQIENVLAMWSLGMPELIVILIIAVLIFGRRLPEIARGVGKSLTEFKKGAREAQDEVTREVDRAADEEIKRSSSTTATKSETQTEPKSETQTEPKSETQTEPAPEPEDEML